ncbi:MAG TPA: hypothetical protein VED41_13460, partial [Solirubrobacteraceae bacterium]|nr:hypothetical protein [Solirubrobacteraceae bacterium]
TCSRSMSSMTWSTGIYAKAYGGAIELAINRITLTLSVALLRFSWRFRRELLVGGAQPATSAAGQPRRI